MSDPPPVDYRSSDDDNGRWLGFPYRAGDIVISTRSKSGTTWMQMICALLVFQSAELPAPLATLSPWLDFRITPIEDVVAQLQAQPHRRFIKTHTPLDGLPLDARAKYIVVARDPLDMAVSLYHQGNNIDRERMAQLIGEPEVVRPPRPELGEWLRSWIRYEVDPRDELDSLPGVLMHVSDAWSRRAAPNVRLVHYDDLSTDLDGEMRRLAAWLGITVTEDRWPELVAAAGFEQMRARADELVPDRDGVLKDRSAFFRVGSSGNGRALLSAAELATYEQRLAQLAPPDVISWLHRR